METRLNSSLWVAAHVRTCFVNDCPAFVIARGDAERGGILLKLDQFESGITLLERTTDFEGHLCWRQIASQLSAPDANDRVAKKRSFDQDLWVIEIEDMRTTYVPDAPVLSE
jgi:hypothetical protein